MTNLRDPECFECGNVYVKCICYRWLSQFVNNERSINNMDESISYSLKNRRKTKDLYMEVKAWLKAPHLSEEEFRYGREMLQLRMLILDKVDEEYYIKRYIKLRTR